jgi:hypothetical protein
LAFNDSAITYEAVMSMVEAYALDHPEFQMCREFGHAMRPTHRDYIGKASGSAFTLLKKLKCRSCGTRRIDEYSSVTRDLIRRAYEYPDGYLLVGMTMSRHDMRSWNMERYLAERVAVERAEAA